MLESTLPSLFTISLSNRLFGDEGTTSVYGGKAKSQYDHEACESVLPTQQWTLRQLVGLAQSES